MKNITLALDERTIKEGREYARKHNMTLNSLIRKLLNQTIQKNTYNWIDECYSLMDNIKISTTTKKWKREDLHRG